MDNHQLRREYVLDQAIAAGKLGPQRRSFWSTQYDANPAGTEQTLAALASGIEGDPPYPRALFPELSRRRSPRTRKTAVAATAAPHAPARPRKDELEGIRRGMDTHPVPRNGGRRSRTRPRDPLPRLMYRAERTAWLALLYRACEHNHYTGFASHLDDLDSCPGEISLATLEAASIFSDLDWQLVSMLIDKPEHAAGIAELLLREGDALTAEALLHAPDHPSPPEEAWAARFAGQRWQDVRQAMTALAQDGLTASADAVEELAVAAYKELTGGSYEDYMDECEEYLFPEYADA